MRFWLPAKDVGWRKALRQVGSMPWLCGYQRMSTSRAPGGTSDVVNVVALPTSPAYRSPERKGADHH